jgi:hypothetical protein
MALMMEEARTSETLVIFYQTTRRYNSEDSHFLTHRRENLKSYLYIVELFGKVLISGEQVNIWKKAVVTYLKYPRICLDGVFGNVKNYLTPHLLGYYLLLT